MDASAVADADARASAPQFADNVGVLDAGRPVRIELRGIWATGEIRSHGALQRRGVTTNAVIVDVLSRDRSGRAAEVMIEFTTDQGVAREPLSVDRGPVPGLEAGHVLVTYDRANPATVKTADAARSLDLWSQAVSLTFGVLSGGFGGMLLAAHFERARRRRYRDPEPRAAD